MTVNPTLQCFRLAKLILFLMLQFSNFGKSFRLCSGIRLVLRRNVILSSTSMQFHNNNQASNRPKLPLSADEQNLFDSLRNFINDANLDITLRVVGGWVRDKLLGKIENHDIDMAVDKMTGLQFVEEYNNWRVLRGETRHSYNIVKKNPDKSKHLETSTSIRFIVLLHAR